MKLPVDDYLALRDGVKSGDLLLCSGSGIFSRMIQHATQSIWSHVAFIIRVDSIDRIFVLESVENIGVRTVPLSSYLRNYNGTGQPYPGKLVLARHQDFPESGIKTISQYAVDLLGHPYNSDEIARIAARISMSAVGLGGDFRNSEEARIDREFICSEYVYICFKSIGISVSYDPRGFIAPKDFADCPRVTKIATLQ